MDESTDGRIHPPLSFFTATLTTPGISPLFITMIAVAALTLNGERELQFSPQHHLSTCRQPIALRHPLHLLEKYHCTYAIFSFHQPSNKSFKTKRILGKAQKQNRPIPQWIRMRTGNTIK
jgi:Ribosomal L39 protein